MKNKKTVFLSAFIGDNVIPASCEKWYEEMESQGWHIDKIGQWSSIVLTFNKAKPKKYRYVYDIQLIPKKDYISTYEQFGWEFVGQMASAFIWRKEYDAERPEAFSDQESLEKRNKRVLSAISVSFLLFLVATIVEIICIGLFRDKMTASDLVQLIILTALCAVFTGYLGYVMRKIKIGKINKT